MSSLVYQSVYLYSGINFHKRKIYKTSIFIRSLDLSLYCLISS